MKKLDGNDQNFLPITRVSCITIMHLLTPHSVREFLATKQIAVLEHPAFSPDLAPSDFFLFPKIKETLKGRHFEDIDDIMNNTMAALKAFYKTISKMF